MTDVLHRRLKELLAGEFVTALSIQDPPVGVALVTVRPNAWQKRPVGLLDELYVAPHRRNVGLGSTLLERPRM